MTYNKPEIANLGDAVSVIHGSQKQAPALTDSPIPTMDFVPAYDLDE